MDSKDELKEIDIKNCTCYYFDDIMKVGGIAFSNILLEEKSYENISIYDISYETFISAKPLRIWFDKIDGFIEICDRIRYLVFFAPERYNGIYNFLISEKKSCYTKY